MLHKYYFAYLNGEFIGIARTSGDWIKIEHMNPEKNAKFNFRVMGTKKGFTLKYKSQYRTTEKG